MKKLNCTSCGAKLKVDENNEYGICEHCGSKYKLNEDINFNIKMDDNISNIFKSFSKVLLIPIIIFIIFLGGIILFISTTNNRKTTMDNKTINNNKTDDTLNIDETINEISNEAKKSKFNFDFDSATGTKSAFFLKDILDNINKSNKTNERQITLIFDGVKTTSYDEIVNIKQNLDDNKDYEVLVNYDDEGYVSEIEVKTL